MKVPGVVLVVSEADPVVMRDHLLVEAEDGLVTGLVRNISKYFKTFTLRNYRPFQPCYNIPGYEI